MQKAAKTTYTTLAARRTVLLRNRFVRLVSTCRQNRSFVTRRTKPGNSGRLPPSAVQPFKRAGSKQSRRWRCRVFRVLWRVAKPARPPRIARSTASTPGWSSQWCGGRGPGSVPCVSRLRSWRFFWPAVSSGACSWPAEGPVQDLLSCQKGF